MMTLETGLSGIVDGILLQSEPERKVAAARVLARNIMTTDCSGKEHLTSRSSTPSTSDIVLPGSTLRPLPLDFSATRTRRACLPTEPARPPGWIIAAGGDMPRRKRPGDPEGAAALVHALAQIELAAIEIDAAQLFLYPCAPAGWQRDMAAIILDECRHFEELSACLTSWGTPFGTRPVHHTLWHGFMAGKTWLEHLALTTRYQEASGVDASHQLLETARSHRSGKRLPTILPLLETLHGDEIRHVAAGSRWWSFAFASGGVGASQLERDEASCRYYFELIGMRVSRPWSRRFPFYLEGRRRAGFTPRELEVFAALGVNARSGAEAASVRSA